MLSTAVIGIASLILPLASVVCGGFGRTVDVEATVAAGMAATQAAEGDLQATIEAAVAATQAAGQTTGEQPPPLASPATSLSPAAAPDPDQVRAVIMAEVEGTASQDLALLRSLYAPGAVVVNRNGTPAEPGDDTIWQGWANIERRYRAFFSTGVSSISLVDLTVQVTGEQATGSHRGAILDGDFYPDQGLYTLEKIDGRWLISRLEYGNEAGFTALRPGSQAGDPAAQPARDDGLYVLAVGGQHRYEEPWGWDRGDPCRAWETGNFDDTRPNYRGFNVELLLTNNSAVKAPDVWPIEFTTAKGKSVEACHYGYEGAGPAPGATSSVTFFTVVEKGDYVEKITFTLDDQTIQLCLDGAGGWRKC